jgi:hypothetical protein
LPQLHKHFNVDSNFLHKRTLDNMRHILAFIVLTFVTLISFAQDKKDLAVSVSAGYFNSPYYGNAHSRGFYGIGFDYNIAKRHLLSANYSAGAHDYFDNTLSNTPASAYIVNPKGTNAKASYNTFWVSYKYKITNLAKLSVVPGVGAGIMTHARDYPYTHATSMIFQTSSWSDLVFPVTLDVNYKLHRHWQIGLTGGFLIHPDYPILALHVGPKLSYVLK